MRELASALDREPLVLFAYLHGSFLDTLGFHDIDVAVFLDDTAAARETDTCLDIGARLTARAAFPIDVRALNSAPVAFRFHALRGRMLLCRDEERLAAVMEDTMHRYFDLQPVLRRAAADALVP